jgi:hypothetical protein
MCVDCVGIKLKGLEGRGILSIHVLIALKFILILVT